MTRGFRWLLGLASLAAVLALGACEKDEPGTGKQVSSLCDDVSCTGESVCNESTGECHCGEGDLICLAGSVCTLDPSPTCISDRCEFTTCTNGQSCDQRDGTCKCGTTACEDGEHCIDEICVAGDACAGVTCPGSEVCDPRDGLCRCGDGPACDAGEVCSEGQCRPDRCAGNPCGAGLVCSQADGLCHCGDDEGPICTDGQACVTDDTGSRCEVVDLCADADTRCGVGTFCDKADGACRCGGVGEGYPVCGDDQVCHEGRCVGGDQCANAQTQCTGGTTCDPEDGICKCGGLFGSICGTDQVCYHGGGQPTCVKTCSVLGSPTCGGDLVCDFERTAPGEGNFYCAKPGILPEGAACSLGSRCSANLHCDIPAGRTSGLCRRFCDVSERPQCGGGNFVCSPLADTGDVGVCVAVAQ